jgi:uncharacterized iron-regulated membrane protein
MIAWRSPFPVRSWLNWSSFRRGLQTAHLWVGLILSIPLIVIGISGSILMLQFEMPRLGVPHAPGRGEIRSIEEIVAAARATLRADARITRIGMPIERGEPASIRHVAQQQRDGGGNYGGNIVYVDPVTLEILGQGFQNRPHWIFGTMRTLHATLFVQGLSERSLVGWIGVAMLLLSLSGLVLWWPRHGRWRSAFSIRRGARGFVLHHDLHAAFGIWTFALFIILSVSGIYLSFPRTFRDGVEFILPMGYNFSPEAEAPATAGLPPLNLDEAVALTRRFVPDVDPATIQIPNRATEVLVMTFQPRGYGVGSPTVLVSVDRQARSVAYVDDPRAYAIGEQVVIWQRLLHSGLGLGLIYKLLVFVSGFLPLLFAITGLRMWWLKRVQRRITLPEAVPEIAE